MSTISEILAKVDTLKVNRVPSADKIGWLSQCDSAIFENIIKTHEPDANTPETFPGYDADTSTDTELLAPAPHDELYRHYLEMQIDLVNMELAKYNNASALYNSAYQGFASWYNRTHKPLSTVTHFKL